MLPDDFQWKPRWQHAKDELALVLDGRTVAMLMRTADSKWVARLDCQQPDDAPIHMRKCATFETGKGGIEAWAAKHQARLRAELRR
jgi:hypothetical protein